MSILNATFYPSPEQVVHALIRPYKFDNAYVLEPSAGDGRILKAIQGRMGHYDKAHLYACELEPELRAVLKECDVPLVGQDFLAYNNPTIRFTHIIMNPPFDHGAGVHHLLHAWELLRSGELACVLPKTALGGNSIFKSTLANLIEAYGKVEDLGKAYLRAERPMSEDICIVRLTKPDPDGEIEFDAERDPNLRGASFEDRPQF